MTARAVAAWSALALIVAVWMTVSAGYLGVLFGALAALVLAARATRP